MNQFLGKKSILITGASTGIGRATAELLAKKGYIVYAGARKKEDLDTLDKISNIYPIKLDVTNEQDIFEAFNTVKTQSSNLICVINNAGVDVLGPILDIDIYAFKWQLDVNLLGVHRIITQFFPLLLKNNGKIINLSSGMGLVSVPFSGMYCASKAGLEAYTDSLRRELCLINKKMKVILIEPGIVKTPIWKKDYPIDLNQSLFKDVYYKWQKINKSPYDSKKKSLSPLQIANVINRVIETKNPKIRYFITENNLYYRFLMMLPEKIKDIFLKQAILHQK